MSIDFDHEELQAAEHWYGGLSCKLYAIVSTGALSRGTIRPKHADEDRPMTDTEWMISIAEDLESDASGAADSAEKMLATLDPDDEESDPEELQADVDGLRSIEIKCREFVERATALLPIDATLPRNSDGTLAAFAWPGGYPITYLLADNACICPACANGRNGSCASVYHEDKQWQIVAAFIRWEGPIEQCEHCNADMESAYGETEDNTEQGA